MGHRDGAGRDRRTQIIRAAIHCLARDGYSALSLKSVAAAADLNQGLLHYYFKSGETTAKRAILDAALEAIVEKVALLTARAGACGDARKSLEVLIDGLLDLDRDTRRVLLQFWSTAVRDKDIDRATGSVYRSLRVLIRRIFRQGQRTGVFRSVRQDDVAVAVLGIVEGIALQRTLSPTITTSRSAIRISTELVIRYLEKPGRYALRRAQQEWAKSEYSSLTRFRQAHQISRGSDLTGSSTGDNIASEDDELEDDHADGDVRISEFLDEDDDE